MNYPNFDWSPYDQHHNDPGFTFDSSVTGPDGQLDYVVICFRPGCNAGLASDTGIAGVSPITFPATPTRPAYSVTNGHGMVNMGLRRSTFLHELAHTLYYSPHEYGANSTVGPYFYSAPSWGMMQPELVLYAANAWKRWFLGWTELQASDGQGGLVSSDVQDASSLAATKGMYTLRDYTTTGDVLRIKLPNAGNQYVWLENHALDGPCDRRIWQYAGDGLPFLPPPTGLLAMVEDMGSRTAPAYNINGLKAVSAEGNFDYNPGQLSTWNNHLFGNSFYRLNGFKGSSYPNPNPTGGHNQNTNFRWDRNGDGLISYDPNDGNGGGGPGNERVINALVGDYKFTDGLVGPALDTSTVGFRYGLDTNPMLIPHQTYDSNAKRLSEIPLSGLSVEIIGQDVNTGALTIRVRYNDVIIRQDTRWTGELRTYFVDNTRELGIGDKVSVYINSGRRLTLDRSATAQRETPSAQGDFLNDTRLTVSNGTKLMLASCASLDLKGSGTTLYVEDGGNVYVSGCAQLTAYAGTTISIERAADLQGVQPYLKVGSQLIIRSSGTVTPGTL